MHCVRNITDDLYYVGADEHRIQLFENIHPISNGVSYNSYLLVDEQTVLFDTVDWAVCRQFIENIKYVLKDRKLDYLVVNHLEPDHAASIGEIIMHYPDIKIISNKKAFMLMRQFGFNVDGREDEISEGDTRCFGSHTITFVFAPMVHWPEAMVSFDVTNGVLFSADAFGSFGALDGKLFNDDMDFKNDWVDEARRYYTNIVGKYGPQVQKLLQKASTIDIKCICPLHGPIWRNDLAWFIEKHVKWSTYEPEEKGILLAYASMYGNTEAAVTALAQKLVAKGIKNIHIHDVSTTHVSHLIAKTFKLSHLILASPTYNLGMYPLMHNFLMDMQALNVQKRTVALVENGSWACKAGAEMRKCLESMKNMTILDEQVTITSSMTDGTEYEMDKMVESIVESINQTIIL